MPPPVVPLAVQSDEGKRLETPTGDTVTVKLDTAATNGTLSVHELLIAPQSGPALHTHLREDELWYVVDGEFRFKADGKMLHASTGGMAFGPRGMAHAFQNVGATPGRLLIVTAPSGLERFFEQFAALPPDEAGPTALAAVGHANWIEFTGPPLAISDPTGGAAAP
jgi:mannose-6-phosphate isomerase-like protein (cupin superfamily)